MVQDPGQLGERDAITSFALELAGRLDAVSCSECHRAMNLDEDDVLGIRERFGGCALEGGRFTRGSITRLSGGMLDQRTSYSCTLHFPRFTCGSMHPASSRYMLPTAPTFLSGAFSPAERADAHKLESLIFIARDIIAFKGYTLAPWEMPARADFKLTTTGWRFDRRSPKRVTYSVGRPSSDWGYNNPASDPLLRTARALAADSRNLIIAVREIATAKRVAALTLKGIADSRELLRRADISSRRL